MDLILLLTSEYASRIPRNYLILGKKFSMKNLLRSNLSEIFNRFTNSKNSSNQTPGILLFDSITTAQDIAFMLGGEWDECNGVTIPEYDEVAINTATKLSGASWCKIGAKNAVLIRLLEHELIKRYATGERNFSNANLRCATLSDCTLSEVNFSCVKLNEANLTDTNFSGADLTAADLSEANLSRVDLSKTSLMRANMTKANLSFADLRGANLSKANLSEACFYQADLRGANLSLADLRGADLSEAQLLRANLTDAKLTLGALDKAFLS